MTWQSQMRLHERSGTIPRLHQFATARAPTAASHPDERFHRSLARPDSIRPQREQRQAEQPSQAGWRRWLVIAFLAGLVIPWVIMLGPVRLSVYRIVLMASILPCLGLWLSGGAGRIRLADIAVLTYCLWGAVCLAENHGIGTAFNSGGILFLETAGSYMLGRSLIRDADDFRKMVLLLFWIIIFLLPFGLIELLTATEPLLQIFGLVLPTTDPMTMEPRWGLERVQGPFDHPILFGVTCGSALALTQMVLGYRRPLPWRWLRTGLVGATAFLSLSSGPFTAMAAQTALLGWNWALGSIKARWKILWAMALGMYASISALSNQSVYAFYLTHAPLFDTFSAYYRLLIWQYGSATVLNHPVFGIGLNEYERPAWMTASVDMFWLIHGIMFGLPGIILMGLAFAGSVAAVGLKRGLDDRTYAYRAGYLISMASFFIAGWAVHFWGATYVLFLFLLGSGMWIADAPASEQATERPEGRVYREAMTSPKGVLPGCENRG